MPVEEWLNCHVPGWAELYAAEKNALRDFPVLWSYFEGWVTHPKTACPLMIMTKVDSLSAALFVDLVATNRAYEHYRNRYFPNGDEASLSFEALALGDRWKEFVQHTMLNVDSEPQQRVKAVLFIINRLRNNFLHGGKALYNFHGQLGNFKHANEVLMELLPIMRSATSN